ncbi:MAG TPA: hypothetical protein VM821_06350, partial [Abditibacteriaceae bacterium]|nr:hypothetical protein [Abditibacteriaceae bacterium]
MNDSLSLPPFPLLEWGKYFWTGKTVLSAWAGFQTRLGAYESVSSDEPSDGSVELSVETPNNEKSQPSPEQAAAYEYSLKNQQEIRDAFLTALVTAYPKWQANYGYDEEEAKEFMPDIASAEQFKSLIG